MTKRVQRFGVDSGTLATIAGLAREIIVNTTKNTLSVHDGVKPGGYELMLADASNGSLATAAKQGLISVAFFNILNGIGALPVGVAQGGTGAANAADARTNLGLTAFASAGNGAQLDVINGNLALKDGEGWNTGDAIVTIRTIAKSGWVVMDDGTIGSAASGASTRANADCENLYTLLWNNIADAYAPVTGGRGADAAADWAANKPIGLLKVLGRALAVAGAGAGLTARNLGEILGEESHALTAAENGPHAHTLPSNYNRYTVGSAGGGGGNFAPALSDGGNTTNSSGNGTPHNTMQPTSFWKVHIRL